MKLCSTLSVQNIIRVFSKSARGELGLRLFLCDEGTIPKTEATFVR